MDKKTTIVQLAKQAGFDYCGISKAQYLENEAPRLEKWLRRGHHGTMEWMQNHFDKRLDPRLLVPGAKTIISLLVNYYPEKDLFENKKYKISRYAYAIDYHIVIKKMMDEFVQLLEHAFGHIEGRCFVDSAPVMDKVWAAKSGLGWIGKNANLITKQHGSYYFVAEYITDLEADADHAIPDYCGTCTRCIDACPTDAISEPYVVDGSKCISYLTIELKDEIDARYAGKMKNWIFGCDICQEVCPWNSFAKAHQNADFKPFEVYLGMTEKDWEEINEDFFELYLKKSALKRTKLKGLKRNILLSLNSPSN
ncbi:MAG: tRNA epoxyqueuosine(34) reductase QueG [Cytophagales bacterium]|nr:tRNA epoxyqueuosine(34) reductase QueG [Cytophagales bacterium]